MFSLKTGYFFGGLTTGLLLLFLFLGSLPDGKLHIVFCNVGQGDSAYITFPDGRDMLVDGGPNDSVLGCLGRHMSFWDRALDIVILTHPEKDHMQGLLSVIERYHIGVMVRSDLTNDSDGFTRLTTRMKAHAIPERLVAAGEQVDVGDVHVSVLWPTNEQLARFKRGPLATQGDPLSNSVLGTTTTNLNTGSVVFWLRYGSFDALFTGDASLNQDVVELAVDGVEVLKMPHHGSKTEFNKDYLNALKPKLAVISVGKNSFGHPTQEVLSALADINAQMLRTDEDGDIEVISDGTGWSTSTRSVE